jgi:hypothetical protein
MSNIYFTWVVPKICPWLFVRMFPLACFIFVAVESNFTLQIWWTWSLETLLMNQEISKSNTYWYNHCMQPKILHSKRNNSVRYSKFLEFWNLTQFHFYLKLDKLHDVPISWYEGYSLVGYINTSSKPQIRFSWPFLTYDFSFEFYHFFHRKLAPV